MTERTGYMGNTFGFWLKALARLLDGEGMSAVCREFGFLGEFNEERPHEALGMKAPADLYTSSSRPYWACRS
ncbi:MAG: hypothetical protein AB7O43_03165 [Hyphomicrobiaceae bacterium]